MAEPRRYEEEEIREIFAIAVSQRAQGRSPGSLAGGLTLIELQSIGGEAGIDPERIAEAAAEMELRRAQLPRTTLLGMPIGVGRTVDLPRAPTAREWEVLVAELRRTFGAVGRETLRSDTWIWRNGSLHVIVEPTEEGYRLRMGTRKSDAMPINIAGVSLLLMSLVLLFDLLSTGRADDAFVPILIAFVGVMLFGYNIVRLPRWAETREQQMRYIASRAVALLDATPDQGSRGAEVTFSEAASSNSQEPRRNR